MPDSQPESIKPLSQHVEDLVAFLLVKVINSVIFLLSTYYCINPQEGNKSFIIFVLTTVYMVQLWIYNGAFFLNLTVFSHSNLKILSFCFYTFPGLRGLALLGFVFTILHPFNPPLHIHKPLFCLLTYLTVQNRFLIK